MNSGSFSKKLRLSHQGSKPNVYLTAEPFKRLALQQSELAQDLIRIAAYVYVADTTITRGGEKDVLLEDWQRHFEFVIPVSTANLQTFNREEVRNSLESTLALLTGDSFKFHFEGGYKTQSDLLFKPVDQHEVYGNTVMLFSGGMDSLCAAVQELANGKHPLLVSHVPRNTLSKLQRQLHKELNRFGSCKLYQFGARIHRRGASAKEHTQRSRGFLYLALGCAIAYDLKIPEVILADNGVVSLNLAKLEESVDTKNSRATWPPFLRSFERFIDRILPSPIHIANPLQYSTRIDVLRDLKANGAEKLLEYTISCASPRATTGGRPHCGVCSQCIDRRFATIAAKLEKYDPPECYTKDIFTESLNEGQEAKLALGHTRFAREVIHDFGCKGEALFIRWPELNSVISVFSREEQPTVAQRFAEMLRRHAYDTLRALEIQFKAHRTDIENWKTASSSLLSLEQDPYELIQRYYQSISNPLSWDSYSLVVPDLSTGIRAPIIHISPCFPSPLNIFVSSVFKGMARIRRIIRESLEEGFVGAVNVIIYEDLPASGLTPEQRIRQLIQGSAIYVALFDVRWGTPVPMHAELSITALEFKIAEEIGLVRLVFLSQQDRKREPKLQQFLDTHIKPFDTGVSYKPVNFRRVRDVAREVKRAITEELVSKYPRAGARYRLLDPE
jgi:7-cyano-7-deazaguanine synthase in queuosine biosynthesis